ncbi:hypothetical protein, partial [Parabacteroides goldsteinii]|uniref:hypothetical protein n=1 Tax=Parabacteroides goldsteinii TaxID=328812 RepID=UPI00256ED533
MKKYISYETNIENCLLDDSRNENALKVLKQQKINLGVVKFYEPDYKEPLDLGVLLKIHNESTINEKNDNIIIGFGEDNYKWLALYYSIKTNRKVTNHQPCWWFAVGPTGP